MGTIRVVIAAVVGSGLMSMPAMAQDQTAVEITPYVAVGSAGAAPVGLAVTIPVSSAVGVETDIAYRRGEGRIHALSTNASALWRLGSIGQASLYLAGGVGLAQYGTPVLGLSGPPIGTQPRLAMTFNAGGGMKMPVGESLGLRTDARWFKSVGSQGMDEFRVAQGISFGARTK